MTAGAGALGHEPGVTVTRRAVAAPEACAQLHLAAFAEAGGAWSAADFAQFAGDETLWWVTVFLHAGAAEACELAQNLNPAAGSNSAPAAQKLGGLLLARQIDLEAEILTLCRAPDQARRGVGAALLDAALRGLSAAGTQRIFLEVAESNMPARRLYAKFGFCAVGRRNGYYVSSDGGRQNAIILQRSIFDGK